MSPVAAAPVQPVIATPGEVAITAATTPLAAVVGPTPEPVKPKPAVKRSAPKKPRVQKLPPVKVGSGTDVAATSQQLTSPLPAVLPDSGVANEPAVVAKIDTPKYNDLLTAVLRSDKDAVRQLLDMGRWVDKPGSSGLTPLLAAVMNEDAQMVKLLLDHGAEPNAQALKLARKNKDAATVLLLEQRGAR
jgi:ankyrin repeat protein